MKLYLIVIIVIAQRSLETRLTWLGVGGVRGVAVEGGRRGIVSPGISHQARGGDGQVRAQAGRVSFIQTRRGECGAAEAAEARRVVMAHNLLVNTSEHIRTRTQTVPSDFNILPVLLAAS